MPLYEYDCTQCRDRVVVDHVLDDDEIERGHTFLEREGYQFWCGPLKRVYSFGGVYWPKENRGH